MPPEMLRRTLIPLIAAVLALPAAAAAKPIGRARWLGRVQVTEYYPVPESWFVGRKVAVPGMTTKHRIDWLYSARGVSMQGTGIDLEGEFVHIDALGSGGWVNERGRPSVPGPDGWSGGGPFWRAGGYWLARGRKVTFPLEAGGWFDGRGRRYVPLPGVTFAEGPSKPLRFYRSIAVDPDLIPLGSRVYIEAYRHTAGKGWFRAEDVGGAIIGRHVDVYRSPPERPELGALMFPSERIYVIPPGKRAGRDAPGRRPPPEAPVEGGGAGTPGTATDANAGGAGVP